MTAKAAAVVSFRQYAGDPTTFAGMLTQPSVLREGHFQLLSGVHTDTFLAFSGIAHDVHQLDTVAAWLQPTVEAWTPTVVLSPSTAGVALAAELARNLSIPLCMALQDDSGRPVGLVGKSFAADDRVLLVNDVTTTGRSIEALASLSRATPASIAGAAWFVSRDPNALKAATYPTVRVADIDLPSWSQKDCRACLAGQGTAERAIDLN
ncbi:phosphoribosyltransferase family protein [Knoellia koreensis]|uniref:Phosphoribosyltransferase domain-containing protein n=1 Tax=Knoellia koreensis TaxID=2730921 RepID=A0A849HKG6_9MICO|nr:hypothetical protein [Knoellia sp. DB2414S]